MARFSDERLHRGVERKKIAGTAVPVFAVAKTVADLFRYRRTVGELLALEALRHHQRPQLRVRSEDAVKSDEVQPRTRRQRRQPLHELQRAHDQVRGAEPGHKPSGGLFVPGEGSGHWPDAACKAVAQRCLQLQLRLPRGIELHASVRTRWAHEVTARLFQPLALVSFDPHRCPAGEAPLSSK